jgi:hypothetical protein
MIGLFKPKSQPEPYARSAASNFIEVTQHPDGVKVQIYLSGQAGQWIVFDTPQRAYRLVDQIEASVRKAFPRRGPPA